MSTNHPATDDNADSASPAKRTRKRASKRTAQDDAKPTDPIILPKPLAMVADYYAYMSKYFGQTLTYEQVIQQAVILLAEAQVKTGNQLPPTMATGLAEFKDTHPAFRPASPS